VYPFPNPTGIIVHEFVKRLTTIPFTHIEGIYLTGSIPLGDYHHGKSDIDFVVLCVEWPGKDLQKELAYHHRQILKKWKKPDLSGVYITREILSIGNPEHAKVLSWHEGHLTTTSFHMAPVTLTELATTAWTVSGPASNTLPIKVSKEMLNGFLHRNINSYWRKWMNTHASFFNRGLLLYLLPGLTEWSVLGMARQLCTLQTGRIVSKSEAGKYALNSFPREYHTIIHEALAIRNNPQTLPVLGSYIIQPSLHRAQETRKCLEWIINRFNAEYQDMDSNIRIEKQRE
jgi:hypothetical protein